LAQTSKPLIQAAPQIIPQVTPQATSQIAPQVTPKVAPQVTPPITKKMPVITPGTDTIPPVNPGSTDAQKIKPLVQIAVLIDTSGSMDGLINQARTRIWDIVNHFTLAERQGQRPEIQVALYEYGNSSLKSAEGYLSMICPLSKDLDLISEELFKLNTDGGDEYCGWVIRSAAQSLAWSEKNNDYKAIIIAGNEPFTQGKIDYVQACKDAVKKGIIINTIYCGSPNSLEAAEWKQAAQLADGDFASIDQNVVQVALATPYDKDLEVLNSQLNSTYQHYGNAATRSKAMARKEVQSKQDSLVKSASKSAFASRLMAKASSAYDNSSWDLVDAVESGKLNLAESDSMLPGEISSMAQEERKEYVETLSKKRNELKEKIAETIKKRESFIEENKKTSGKDDDLGKAVINFISNQASSKGFIFKSK
jgi:hypothetical protein